MKANFLIVIFFGISSLILAQTRDEVPVFSALNASEVVENPIRAAEAEDHQIKIRVQSAGFPSSIENLSLHLTRNLKSDREKVLSIFSWIAVNITYDSAALKAGSVPDQSAEATFDRGVAVCEGFARLFSSICRHAGIDSRVIKGYVRDENATFDYPNHAWNSVLIDGKWNLLDVTWAGLNYQAAVNSSYSNAWSQLNSYFLPAPESLVISHLPEDPYWQLLPSFITLKQFIAGENAINASLLSSQVKSVDFENLISSEDKLDSLDREINFLKRMVSNQQNGSREYALAIAYYYKAQQILQSAEKCESTMELECKNKARFYYQCALEQLNMLESSDFEYEFSRAFATNVSQRLNYLQ